MVYLCRSGLSPSKPLRSKMLLEIHLRSKHLSNNSATSGFVWEEFDFEMCNRFEGYKYMWAMCTTLCFVLGFPACVVILWEMFKTHRNGTPFTPNCFFILNVSIMDAIFLVLIPPGVLNHLIWETWVVEASWNAIYALNSCGRPLLMACICLDSYLAVVHPITYHKRKSLTPRVVMVGMVWTWTVAFGIAYFLFYHLYFSMFSTVPFIIAIIIIGICDSFILHALVKSDPGRKNIHPQKQRAVQTLINSLVITVLSYLPPILLVAIGKPLINSFSTFICVVGIPATLTSTLGSAVMPILHLINKGKWGYFRLGCSPYKIRWYRN